jgi:hypothetical protein
VTSKLILDPCRPELRDPLLTAQPLTSSEHARPEPERLPLRAYSTVSKAVFGLQVSMVTVPDASGIHSKTCSGARTLPVPQLAL